MSPLHLALYGLRARNPVRGWDHDYGATMFLWYPTAPLERLLRDVATLAPGLPAGGTIRIRTDDPEALKVVPAFCVECGYELLEAGPSEPREGAFCPGDYQITIRRP